MVNVEDSSAVNKSLKCGKYKKANAKRKKFFSFVHNDSILLLHSPFFINHDSCHISFEKEIELCQDYLLFCEIIWVLSSQKCM